jgi:GH24 family phage-related lysozyme (muramidase)
VATLVKLNPGDPFIADTFKTWNKANEKVLQGLVKRWEVEAKLYFTTEMIVNES